MRILITGCGKIGSAILDRLSHTGHDIIAIDLDQENVDTINSNHDVLAIAGRGTDIDLLRSIEAGKADIVIATSYSDEVNALSCLLVKKLGAKHAVARIADTIYSDDTLRFIKNQLGIDIILNPPKLAGYEICNRIKNKGARNIMIVGGGRTGAFTAKFLASEGCRVKLIEKDEDRCDYLVSLLPESVEIIHGDGTDHNILTAEGISHVQAFVSVADIEEENILLSVFAKSCNVPYATARVRQREFMEIGLNLGIDDIISVNDITADIIDKYVKKVADDEL